MVLRPRSRNLPSLARFLAKQVILAAVQTHRQNTISAKLTDTGPPVTCAARSGGDATIRVGSGVRRGWPGQRLRFPADRPQLLEACVEVCPAGTASAAAPILWAAVPRRFRCCRPASSHSPGARLHPSWLCRAAAYGPASHPSRSSAGCRLADPLVRCGAKRARREHARWLRALVTWQSGRAAAPCDLVHAAFVIIVTARDRGRN